MLMIVGFAELNSMSFVNQSVINANSLISFSFKVSVIVMSRLLFFCSVFSDFRFFFFLKWRRIEGGICNGGRFEGI